ncbi:hypothetical protein BS47DRAFT_1335514 [Hydnum rufescens UP504]|uniref:Uncharacterized protein n=1 Tax=Hydnum rufescens UP504 TaxID=1448309 RepID=A0A9P6BAN1_9AGAM|nr:hypothetical protein BS47DRAFT_1335514 [Hydnum rufescens UP504]
MCATTPSTDQIPSLDEVVEALVTLATRCSVCNQWIPTSGGTHVCPGASKSAPKNKKVNYFLLLGTA